MADGSARPCYTGGEVLNLLDINGEDTALKVLMMKI